MTTVVGQICLFYFYFIFQILFSNIGFLFTIHAGVNLAFSNLLLEEFDTEVSSWCGM